VLKGVHDYAQVFVDGAFVASVDRRDGEDAEISLPLLPSGAKLDILVDATGRVSDVKRYKDYKGITRGVELLDNSNSVKELTEWNIYPLPTDYSFVSSKNFKNMPNAKIPGYYRVTFDKVRDGDFYLYMGDWGKGEVWLNGRPLGRFWNCGPQTALYVPGCWVKDTANELVIVDWIGPSNPSVLGTDYAKM
jgi:beta-galactosidase